MLDVKRAGRAPCVLGVAKGGQHAAKASFQLETQGALKPVTVLRNGTGQHTS